jgi:DNA polymerase III epsilon subunit-like protein
MVSPLADSHDWFNRLRDTLGAPPRDYLVIDVETTGLSVTQDLITQVGFCQVLDGRAVGRGSVVLNWDQDKRIDQDWFRERLNKCEREMNARGATCHMTYDVVTRTGFEPQMVMEGFFAMIDEAVRAGHAIVGHNHIAFDIPLLQSHASRFLGRPDFTINMDLAWDTGMIEKARQLALLPSAAMTRSDFFKDVRRRFAKGVLWSLDKVCVPTYHISEKYDLNFAEAHEAGFDCYLTHLVLESQRAHMLAPTPVEVAVPA